jgi:parallel beta-helix repeat protein
VDNCTDFSLNGNTITNGWVHGIHVTQSSGIISGNTMSANESYGIYLLGTEATVSNNTISSNGGGIYAMTPPLNIANNTITANSGPSLYLIGASTGSTISGNTVSGNDGNGIFVQGTIDAETHWQSLDTPYLAYGTFPGVTVSSSATLTIAPGVVVKFQGSGGYGQGGGMDVQGTLIADGTPADPIIFTSFKDDAAGGDTNGDGGATSPSQYDWHAVRLGTTSRNNVLDNVEVRYGGYGPNQALRVESASTSVTDTIFYNCSAALGISDVDLNVSGNIFTANGNAIYLANSASTITGAQIDASTGNGIVVDNCTDFSLNGNTITNGWAHGISITLSSGTIANNVIASNASNAIRTTDLCALAFINNTIAKNGQSGLRLNTGEDMRIINNIIAGNGEYGVYYGGSPLGPALFFNDVFDNSIGDYQGCTAGPGDISADPLFRDPANGDYRLMVASPCIDAGDPVENLTADHVAGAMVIAVDAVTGLFVGDLIWITDGEDTEALDVAAVDATSVTLLAGLLNSYILDDQPYLYSASSDFSMEPPPNGNRVNMGAFGGTAHATVVMSGDLDGDGDVDGKDLALLAAEPGLVALEVFAGDYGRLLWP